MFIKKYFIALITVLLLSIISVQLATAYSKDSYIKQRMRVSAVTELPGDYKVHELSLVQKTISQLPDSGTSEKKKKKITGLNKAKTALSSKRRVIKKPLSRGGASRREEIKLLPWFNTVEKLFGIGDVATVIDVATGIKMQVKRTYGHNHADVETLTDEYTETLKKVVGGSWNWTRRPVIVEIDGYRLAGSLTAMPHAGRDDMPGNKVVSGRSGGYGSGINLDAVKGNGMDGHFDIHFYGSKTHSTNRVDDDHQEAIQKAYKSGK